MLAHEYGGQGSTLGIIPNKHHPPWVLRQDLLLSLEFAHLASLAAPEHQGESSHLPGTGTFLHGSKRSNLSPHTFKASSLPTELSPSVFGFPPLDTGGMFLSVAMTLQNSPWTLSNIPSMSEITLSGKTTESSTLADPA